MDRSWRSAWRCVQAGGKIQCLCHYRRCSRNILWLGDSWRSNERRFKTDLLHGRRTPCKPSQGNRQNQERTYPYGRNCLRKPGRNCCHSQRGIRYRKVTWHQAWCTWHYATPVWVKSFGCFLFIQYYYLSNSKMPYFHPLFQCMKFQQLHNYVFSLFQFLFCQINFLLF